MAQQSDAAGSIYDLGYRRYEGARLGRRYAVLSLYLHSLRACFGLGRRNPNKIIPVGLAIFTFIPAIIQLGIAAIADNIVEVYKAENYYGFIQWPLALFVAAVAPEVVGRDQRNRTLSLYFSRSLSRLDYAAAKVGALTTALLLLTLAPQLVLFTGNALAGNDIWGYVRGHWGDVPPIVAAGATLSLFMASIALAIASRTPRRAYATGGILAYFAISTTVGALLVNISSGELRRWTLLVSGFHIMRGLTLWIFGVTPRLNRDGTSDGPGGDLALADLPLALYFVAAAVIIAGCLYLVHRRYQRIAP